MKQNMASLKQWQNMKRSGTSFVIYLAVKTGIRQQLREAERYVGRDLE